MWLNSECHPASKQYPDGEIADVLNLETGELQTMKITKVAGSELRKGYPGDGYLGKEFAILPYSPDNPAQLLVI